jgi:hypothetical protein
VGQCETTWCSLTSARHRRALAANINNVSIDNVDASSAPVGSIGAPTPGSAKNVAVKTTIHATILT